MATKIANEHENEKWPEPEYYYLRDDLLPPPALPVLEVLGPGLAGWVTSASDAKGAPSDYVLVALLTVAGSLIGNTRWVSPWKGWTEPPIIWVMCIGQPSSGKSPAIDAVLQALFRVEKPLRRQSEAAMKTWLEKSEIAKLVEASWKEAAKAAIKAGEAPPNRPSEIEMGPAPHSTRLIVNDGTIERLGEIVSKQPRGILQMRDELSGWLEGMTRYSSGGSDRPFWLESYGGRRYTVERIGRPPFSIDRLAIGVLGGIQPARLKTLLFASDDDGLLARFLPIWPSPAPVKRPTVECDDTLIENTLQRLLSLELVTDESGEKAPLLIIFSEEARDVMDRLRSDVRKWELENEGLMVSFIGKLPGLTARIALILAFLDWAAEGACEPESITREQFVRAVTLTVGYILPMAERAYANASLPKPERAARRLVATIREKGWQRFTYRELQRLERSGLSAPAEINAALTLLEEADCIRAVTVPPLAKGGRPPRMFQVNPAVHDKRG